MLRSASDAAWRLLVLIVLGAALVWVLVQLRLVVIPVILAVFAAALLAPAATWLRDRGFPRWAATTTVFVGGIIVLGLFVAVLVPSTVDRLDQLGNDVRSGWAELRGWAEDLGLTSERVDQLLDQARREISQRGGALATGALTGAVLVAEIVVGFVLTLVLAVYFVHGGDRLATWLTELAPYGQRGRLVDSARLAWDVVGKYVRGIAIVGFVDAALIGMGLLILGIPLVLPLAVITFLGAFFPFVGAFLAGLIAALVALVAKGPLFALFVVLLAIGVQQLEGHVVAPQIYGRTLELPAVVVILAIAGGSVLGGILGAFLATPVVAVVVALLRQQVVLPPQLADDEGDREG